MSEPTPEQREEAVSIVELFRAFQVSIDADCLTTMYRDLAQFAGEAKAAEPCDCLPVTLREKVLEIQSRYWSIFPVETSLYAAAISMENHARDVRDKARKWIPTDAAATLTALQTTMHDATAWLSWLVPQKPRSVVYITDGGAPDATTND